MQVASAAGDIDEHAGSESGGSSALPLPPLPEAEATSRKRKLDPNDQIAGEGTQEKRKQPSGTIATLENDDQELEPAETNPTIAAGDSGEAHTNILSDEANEVDSAVILATASAAPASSFSSSAYAAGSLPPSLVSASDCIVVKAASVPIAVSAAAANMNGIATIKGRRAKPRLCNIEGCTEVPQSDQQKCEHMIEAHKLSGRKT